MRKRGKWRKAACIWAGKLRREITRTAVAVKEKKNALFTSSMRKASNEIYTAEE